MRSLFEWPVGRTLSLTSFFDARTSSNLGASGASASATSKTRYWRLSCLQADLSVGDLKPKRVRGCSPRGRARQDVNALSLYFQPKSSISGVHGVRLRPMAQMPQFTIEASWRVSIQQLRCAAEFRQIPENRAKDGLGKGSAARTLAHAALTLSNANRCVAFSPLTP